MPQRSYKGHMITDHVDAHLDRTSDIYRRYSVNFAGNDFGQSGPDMALLRTEWFHTLKAAKLAISKSWDHDNTDAAVRLLRDGALTIDLNTNNYTQLASDMKACAARLYVERKARHPF